MPNEYQLKNRSEVLRRANYLLYKKLDRMTERCESDNTLVDPTTLEMFTRVVGAIRNAGKEQRIIDLQLEGVDILDLYCHRFFDQT